MLAVFAVGHEADSAQHRRRRCEQAAWVQWQLETIAYLYQFSTLIMPGRAGGLVYPAANLLSNLWR